MKKRSERRSVLRFSSDLRVWSGCLLIVLASALFMNCGRSSPGNSAPQKDPEVLARERGAEIISEYLKRDASPYRQTRVRVTVKNEAGSSQVYELEVLRKQTAAETLTLTRIIQPASQQNVASLTTESKGADATNLTYISANDQFRETGTDKSFFGGVTAQEFLGEWDKYDFSLINEKDLNGIRSYELEGRLKPKRRSIITRLTVLVRSDTFLPAEMHAFNSDGQELRTFRIGNYRTFDHRAAVERMDIENHIFKTRVLVEIINMTFPERMDDSLFSREHLKQLSLS